MAKRRKFLAGIGALASGSAAAVGTGALSTASVGRTVAADVTNDANAQIGLVAGDVSDISQKSNGEIELSLTGDGDGLGVNTNSVYKWGTGDDNYAFALVNNDDSTYEVIDFTYELNDTSWLDANYDYKEDSESFIEFAVSLPSSTETADFPRVISPSKYSSDPSMKSTTHRIHGESENTDGLTPGETWPVVVTIDTTEGHSNDDLAEVDLSGKLTIEVSGRVD
ncbi:hypothetical protein PM022_18440 [Halorubrum ezzemoulense]|uniref:hypothetical protein n=1 Tax=Halorubrum ezzemoulense TaxID=337243 RepID=UPI00232F67D2|nr:hypothetical protein [Halorubrum ezzemoulense]MDB2276470.1 hypothetical protein [Halorubrum ezzemoulense]